MRKYYEEFVNMKICNWSVGDKNSEVKIRGTKTVDMPMWIINNYIKSTCDNYTKLVYILKIIDIYSKEETDIVDIGISTSSVPIGEDGKNFEDKLIGIVKNSKIDKSREKYCLLSDIAEEGKKDFWYYFSKCDRPICFAISKENDVILLYNPRGSEGIKVCDISYHSPIDIGWGGVGACIEILVNARTQVRNDKRLQEEHEAKMITQAMQTIKEGISVQNMLQNNNLPGSHKEYLQRMYDGIMAKQEKLNEQIGICHSAIDEMI